MILQPKLLLSKHIFLFLPPLFAAISFFIYYKIKVNIISKEYRDCDVLEETNNLLSESINEKKAKLDDLPLKRERTSFLFNISQHLIELIDIDQIYDSLNHALSNLFPQADSILIFDYEKEKNSLKLVRSFKSKKTVIKEKRGSEIDSWVLQRNQSLLIVNLVNDFKFDYHRIKAFKDRGIHSIIASPLSIGYKTQAVVRAESKEPMKFNLDDLRILRNICDLGAVVLEKANLLNSAQNLAIKDSLTSMFVKEYFYQRLSEEINRSRIRSTALSVIMLDIDDFKKINDTYGHVVGDLVLVKLSKLINNIVSGGGNIIGRFGGEEFIISIVESNKDMVLDIANRIAKTAQASALNFRRKKINFTVSQGIAFYPEDGNDMLEIVKVADTYLYEAKSKGKNCICYSKP